MIQQALAAATIRDADRGVVRHAAQGEGNRRSDPGGSTFMVSCLTGHGATPPCIERARRGPRHHGQGSTPPVPVGEHPLFPGELIADVYVR
ncbi:hypothetical protein STRIP9103_00196 [Streptomyces ipomoeae 91-03]|uniref:Uncharacterized protein n=1 Tax=Streptomyces ipomoeae 91-03 TaxID=698759 RepID=L1KLW7_9ACTN|nr:hypothetical protein STRIP9103_00196 [Streptomyces ipomoeae 91-03]